jgi:hypothetical protein
MRNLPHDEFFMRDRRILIPPPVARAVDVRGTSDSVGVGSDDDVLELAIAITAVAIDAYLDQRSLQHHLPLK